MVVVLPIRVLLLLGLLAGRWSADGRSTMTVLSETNCTAAERETLAVRAGYIGKEAADLIENPTARVVKLPTPFFRDGAVYRVTVNLPSNPVVFTLGTSGREHTVMLPMNPEGFFALAEKAGLTLGSAELFVKYAEVFLESTRDFRQRLQILRSASDIELIANPSAEQKSRYQTLQQKYDAIIQPPKTSPLSTSEVVLFALVGQDLEEIRLKIASDGEITRADSVKEKDLPIAVTR